MGGVVSVLMPVVIILLVKVFSRRPAVLPLQVRVMAETAATAHDQKVGHGRSELAAAPPLKPERSSPAAGGRNVETAGKVGESVQEEVSRIVKEARKQVGVDCVNYYNFAVCGQSGVGKSSFINGFLGLKGSDACAVGEVETTQQIKKHSTKQAPHLVVWDIPGAGTLDHPADTYFEDKKLYVFDAILILSSDRFLAVHFGILRSARKYGTPCVFIRTKCDISVHSRAQRDGIDTLTASQRIRRDVQSNFDASLANAGLKDITPAPQLFFINNNFFWDEDAYAFYNKKTKVLDTSLSCMDELKLTSFLYETAKVRAPQLKE